MCFIGVVHGPGRRAAYTMGTGIAVLLLFFTLGLFAIDDGTPLHPWAGLIQRVLCAVWFTCMVVLALRLRRLARSGARWSFCADADVDRVRQPGSTVAAGSIANHSVERPLDQAALIVRQVQAGEKGFDDRVAA